MAYLDNREEGNVVPNCNVHDVFIVIPGGLLVFRRGCLVITKYLVNSMGFN